MQSVHFLGSLSMSSGAQQSAFILLSRYELTSASRLWLMMWRGDETVEIHCSLLARLSYWGLVRNKGIGRV